MNFLFASIDAIISNYKGEIPLAAYLKKYFKQHPKLGSRDRKSITEAVFVYYRCVAFSETKTPTLNTVYRGMQICKSENNYLKDAFEKVKNELEQPTDFSIQNWPYYIAFTNRFSAGIQQDEWLKTLFSQSDLFIRVRTDKAEVKQKLKTANLEYQEIRTGDTAVDCFSFKNSTKVDSVLAPKEFVVQDWASQSSMSVLMDYVKDNFYAKTKATVWDVCAGAGGKSIFWKDQRPDDFLLATDIRDGILKNLKERFSIYGIQHFQSLAVDVENSKELSQKQKNQSFDVIICDAPCSGSGTWARTPEQFYFFKPEVLAGFAEKQYNIAFEAQKYLKQNSVLAYITCSVFKDENEQVVQRLVENTSLKLIRQQLINGISHKADSLFVALFIKA